MIWMPSSRAVPSNALKSDRDQYDRAVAVAPWPASILPNGSSKVGWPSTGPYIRKAITPPRRTKQSGPTMAYGAAALLSGGGIEPAGKTMDHPPVATI
jgi:hypothetical protein